MLINYNISSIKIYLNTNIMSNVDVYCIYYIYNYYFQYRLFIKIYRNYQYIYKVETYRFLVYYSILLYYTIVYY